MSTLPPSFPMEKWKDRVRLFNDAQGAKEHIAGILRGVFPKEKLTDSMTIRFFLWMPHNYRLKVPFKGFSGGRIVLPKEVEGTMGAFPLKRSSKGIVSVVVSDRVVVQVCKSCVVAIWSGDGKWLKVGAKAFDEFVDMKVDGIMGDCLGGLKSLGFGDLLDFGKAVWIRQENGIKGDEFLDSLPQGLSVNDTSFKKVYDDKVEFKDAGLLKNYVSNRVLEDFSDFEGRLRVLEARGGLVLEDLIRVIKCPDDVISFGGVIVSLPLCDRVALTDWIFASDCGRRL